MMPSEQPRKKWPKNDTNNQIRGLKITSKIDGNFHNIYIDNLQSGPRIYGRLWSSADQKPEIVFQKRLKFLKDKCLKITF